MTRYLDIPDYSVLDRLDGLPHRTCAMRRPTPPYQPLVSVSRVDAVAARKRKDRRNQLFVEAGFMLLMVAYGAAFIWAVQS